jgi:hypothetical protein
MSSSQLKRTRQSYLVQPNATELHTVDVWTSDSVPLDEESKKLWVMFVNPPLAVYVC